MPIRRRNNIVARQGVNFFRQLFENNNFVFREIPTESDYGHDANILFVDGEQVMPNEIAVQIKSGKTYCTKTNFKIPANNDKLHFWANHPLRTLGLVFDPDERQGYWVDLKHEANVRLQNPEIPRTVSIAKLELNRLNDDTFSAIFLRIFHGKPPEISQGDAIRWLKAKDPDLHHWGIGTLLRRYPNKITTWNSLLRDFKGRNINEIDPLLVYALAHIPGHPDIFYTGLSDIFWKDICPVMCMELSNLNDEEMLKLLLLVDENGLERGAIGESVAAIFAIHVDYDGVLTRLSRRELPGYTQEIIQYMINEKEYIMTYPSRRA